MFIKRILILTLTVAIALSSGISLAGPAAYADKIFKGGDILTMNDAQPTAQAVAVKDGKIIAVGRSKDVLKYKGPTTEIVDLAGHTLMPGLIDAHSHFFNAVQMMKWANVSVPPVGPVKDIPSLVATLKNHVAKIKLAKGEWIIAYGYDGDQLREHRDITTSDLDGAFPGNPVILIHVSNHGAVLNSMGLKLNKITAQTPTPAGGVIVRKPGSQEPAGLVMETAFLPVFANMPQPTPTEMLDNIKAAQQLYAANGYTTITEGATCLKDLNLLQQAAAKNNLFLDVISLPLFTELDEILKHPERYAFGRYSNHLKLGGMKILNDGSPQGKTAYFSRPYLVPGPAGQRNWRGEPTMPQADFDQIVKMALDHKVQIFTHSNGDAAIDMTLNALKRFNVTKEQDLRPVIVHSQFVRPDQINDYVKLGVFPSLFTAHAFYWGDAHIVNLGQERAQFLSPMRAVYERGMTPTNHTDFSVIPLDPTMPIWSAMKRETRTGKILDANQRATAEQALKAMTINGAIQYREENLKGSLEVGKLADMVIFDKNPLKVPVDEIRKSRVVQTMKEGKTVFPSQ